MPKAFASKAYPEIHRFDSPAEHRKAGGCHDGPAATELGDLHAAEKVLKWDSDKRRDLTLKCEREARRRDLTDPSRSTASALANKQGAYGKVPTHAHSKLEQLLRPLEVSAALYIKFVPGAMKANLKPSAASDPDMAFCDVKLGEVSRSFAAVIRQLPEEMAREILIFYLVLRALDTVEDDMDAFKGREAVKCQHLRDFGSEYLGDEKWTMSGVGEGAERALLEGFDKVSRAFNQLRPGARDIIRDITEKMGAGMAEYVSVDMGQGTVSLDAYARYVSRSHFTYDLGEDYL